MPEFLHRSRLDHPASEVFAWHARPGAFERLMPPWIDARVLERTGGLADGARLVFEIRRGPFRQRWVAVHRGYIEGREFTDVQLRGPFAHWEHTHRFEAADETSCLTEDLIHYQLPAGRVGRLLGDAFVRRELVRMFTLRHDRTRLDLARHARFEGRPRQRIAVTGANGLIGRSLCAFLTTGGHEVTPLVRRAPRAGEIGWDPRAGRLEAKALEGFDAIIHLAGESIASGRWTEKKKREIQESRVAGTRLIARTLTSMERPPRTWICASAIGYYGDRGDEIVTEASGPGTEFVSTSCAAWEAETAPAAEAGIRVAVLRTGIVLSAAGGALEKMLLPFGAGLGAIFGSGEQAMSWIAHEDVIGATHHILFTEALSGPINLTAEAPVPQREFARLLGEVLRRPVWARAPAPLVELLFGEMGRSLLLGGARVAPTKLLEHGFEFAFPDLETTMRSELGLLEEE